MDRFEYAEAKLAAEEDRLFDEFGIKLYDGEDKTFFDRGQILLTSHRLVWGPPNDISLGIKCLSLPLYYVVLCEVEHSSSMFDRKKKVVLHLLQVSVTRTPGPIAKSRYDFIKLYFKDSQHRVDEFVSILNSALQKKKWVSSTSANNPSTSRGYQPKLRHGIVGIERQMEQRNKATDATITKAFEDLTNLMSMAKEMVNLSKVISSKIKDKHGDISEDETVKFKTYLMSFGVDDPVTREGFKSENAYHRELAKEVADIMEVPIKDVGGMMTLADVYCRVNRARGLELISPEDLLGACVMLEQMNLPIKLREFESGVKVLQLLSHNEKESVENTRQLVREKNSLTAEELAQLNGISVILAREHLLCAEKAGKVCRDDSIEGLRFYPNIFLER